MTVFESGGLVDELKKRLAERMLTGEMEHHPVLPDQHPGMTTQEIAAHVDEFRGIEISPDLGSRVLKEVAAG